MNSDVLCTKCRLYLPRDSFHVCKDKKNGLTSWCKSCKQEGVRALRLSMKLDEPKPRGCRYRGWHGSKSPLAKLNEDDVRWIRDLVGHLPYRKIAEKFDVHWQTIAKIARRETWSHI